MNILPGQFISSSPSGHWLSLSQSSPSKTHVIPSLHNKSGSLHSATLALKKWKNQTPTAFPKNFLPFCS